MVTLDAYSSALALSFIVAGLALAVLPLLDRFDWRARTGVLAVSTLLAWRYMHWRFAETIPPFALAPEPLLAWAFAGLEAATVVSSSLAAFILTRTRNRSGEADRHAGWWSGGPAPRLDVYITTYNEELSVLERTIVGAKAMTA